MFLENRIGTGSEPDPEIHSLCALFLCFNCGLCTGHSLAFRTRKFHIRPLTFRGTNPNFGLFVRAILWHFGRARGRSFYTLFVGGLDCVVISSCLSYVWQRFYLFMTPRVLARQDEPRSLRPVTRPSFPLELSYSVWGQATESFALAELLRNS